MILKYESTLGKSDTKGKSSRTIVPKAITDLLEAKWGDKLVWSVEIIDNKPVVTVSKKEDES